MKTKNKILALSAIIGGLALQQVSANVIGVDLGTGLPGATLGGYTMTSYDPGSIAGATQYQVGVSWATWGQGYTGHVYASPVFAGPQSVTLTLSGGVGAVYFYEEPNQFADFLMIATDSSGAQVSTTVNGNAGAAGVGFYETVSGDFLTSITVQCTDPDGFAIGEFGVDNGNGTVSGQIGGAVPDTGWTLAYLVFGILGLTVVHRRIVRFATV